jgi:hypothetical protein
MYTAFAVYFQCTILRQVVVVMGAGIGKSVKYRSESPSRRTSAAFAVYHYALLAAQGESRCSAAIHAQSYAVHILLLWRTSSVRGQC